MGNRCIRPLEKQSGDSSTSLDWDDETSIHNMSARNSRHNSGLGKIKSVGSLSTNSNADSIQNTRLQGSIRKKSNGSVRQQFLNISFADEIHQTYLFERDSDHSEHGMDMIEGPAIQIRQPPPPQKNPVLSQRSKTLTIKAQPTIQIAS